MTHYASFLYDGGFSLGRGKLLRIQTARFCKHQRTREFQQVVADLVARQRGFETIGREDIWELGEEFRDALRNREKVSTETGGGGWNRRVKADLKRTRIGQAKNSLVGERRWWWRKSALRMGRETGAS